MRLKQQMQQAIRRQGKAFSTFKAYWAWVERFLRFHKDGETWVHPQDLSEAEVESFLTHLAVEIRVAPSSQNQALQAILYLYKVVLGVNLTGINAMRAKPRKTVPVILSRDEITRLLNALSGQAKLVACLQYGCGLRIGEAVSVRLKDIDFDRNQLTVRAGKGGKDRITCLPPTLKPMILKQMEYAKRLLQIDIDKKNNGTSLPNAFSRKSKSAALSLAWCFLFPSKVLSTDPETNDGVLYRHHIHKSNICRQIKAAGERAGIIKRVKSHCLRHAFCTHLLESGTDLRMIQELAGHASIETTQIYIHVNKDAASNGSRSPLETLELAA